MRMILHHIIDYLNPAVTPCWPKFDRNIVVPCAFLPFLCRSSIITGWHTHATKCTMYIELDTLTSALPTAQCLIYNTPHTCPLIIPDRLADFLPRLLAATRAYIMSCSQPQKWLAKKLVSPFSSSFLFVLFGYAEPTQFCVGIAVPLN